MRAGVSGRVEQFFLRVGDVVNPLMRPAGVLIPSGAGRRALTAGFNQIEAQVMKVGMIAEAVCISKPFTVIPMVVTSVQDYIAAGQFRGGEQLIDPQQVRQPGTILVFLEPLCERGLYGVTPGSSCIANAYSNNHDLQFCQGAAKHGGEPGTLPGLRASIQRLNGVNVIPLKRIISEAGWVSRPVTNVRDDQIRTNPFWRDSFHKRRCLVPASSFCEPNGDVKPASWHWFALKGEGERALFGFPGIWRRYQGPLKKDGPNVDIETYAFLTTTPNPLVATINHERMPVVLTREDEFQTWLNGTPDQAFALTRNILPIAWRSCRRAMTRKTCLAARPSNGEAVRCCRNGQRLASCRLALR